MEGAPEEGEDAADVAEEVDMIADAIWTTQQGSAAGVVGAGERCWAPREGAGKGRKGGADGEEAPGRRLGQRKGGGCTTGQGEGPDS